MLRKELENVLPQKTFRVNGGCITLVDLRKLKSASVPKHLLGETFLPKEDLVNFPQREIYL